MSTMRKTTIFLVILLIVIVEFAIALNYYGPSGIFLEEPQMVLGFPTFIGLAIGGLGSGGGSSGGSGSALGGKTACIDADNDGHVTEENCALSQCEEEPSCINEQYDCDDTNPYVAPTCPEGSGVSMPEICTNELDDDNDGVADCDDADCSTESHCIAIESASPSESTLQEDCNSDVDDDNDGFIDCDDTDCASVSYCQTNEEVDTTTTKDTNFQESIKELTIEGETEESSETESGTSGSGSTEPETTSSSTTHSSEEGIIGVSNIANLSKKSQLALTISLLVVLLIVVLIGFHFANKKLSSKRTKKRHG